MIALAAARRKSVVGTVSIGFLLCFSLLVAAPLRASAASGQAVQVVPTVLSGYHESGSLAASTPVLVTIGIPLQNVQTLDYLTQQISTPGSPLYRHFLTHQQIQQFLPTAEYESALAYLDGLGLKIVSTSLDSVIVAQGTASQVSSALGIRYQVYTNGTSTYYTSAGTSPIAGAYLYSSNVTSVFLAHPPDLAVSPGSSEIAAQNPSTINQTVPQVSYDLTDLRAVYNATVLYREGDTGAGYTVGILDFYGDPYISQQLEYFDTAYNLPSSPFTVTPIGPYNPSLGTVEGWTPEISLDVESVHAMAPQASIDLYIANAALPLAAVIASVVQAGVANDVTQSWGYPEADVSEFGATGLELTVVLADQYYELGSATGMTFIGASGDSGGSGDSAGPEGALGYPESSPWVVSVGGTTTYLDFEGTAVTSFVQTAWSSTGDVELNGNGGTTGGVSILEPLPWYQDAIPVPSTFASGRLNPDLSLNANIFPAVNIILPGNVTAGYGGTSESDQLFGGLLTLLMSAAKGGFGLLNPTLYSWGDDPATYSKVYDPITFGYDIPWVASSGYNLLTGFGAPNIGEMANYVSTPAPKPLAVNVSATVGGAPATEVLPGQTITISAAIHGSNVVTTGQFTAQLETLAGDVAGAGLTYQASTHSWVGQISLPEDAAGITYVTVSGVSGSSSGTGFAEIFSGYLATYSSPTAITPYSSRFGIPLVVNITTLDGTPATGNFDFTASTYSIISNTYTNVATVPANFGPTDFGDLWSGTISGKYADGPMMISGDGSVWGYLPIFNGVGMLGSYLATTVVAQPGVVAPGQGIFVVAELSPPENLPAAASAETGEPVSYNVEVGSNVTVSLLSQSGAVVAKTTLYSNTFLTSSEQIQGILTVPSGLPAGLYDVILNSTYNSPDLQAWVNGTSYGQVYVSPSLTNIVTTITPTPSYEGQTVTVNARITYANGSLVKYGVYSGTLYPAGLQNDYNLFFEVVTFQLVFDSTTGLWTATVTLPSAYNRGGTVEVDQGALYLSGPYAVFIDGISADGVPSNSGIATQQQFQVQPYLYVGGTSVTSLPQSSQVVFDSDTLTGPATPTSAPSLPLSLSDDLFVGTNTIGGAVTITQSQIQGTLDLQNANVTLIGVTGGIIVADDSSVVLEQSSIGSLQLTGSHVSMNASVVGEISPQPATVSIESPVSGSTYSGMSGDFTVTGQDVSGVSVYLDGTLIKAYSGAASYSVPLVASNLTVGVHTLRVVVTQQDGLSSSSSVAFSTDGPLVAATNSISSLTSQVSSLTSQVSSENGAIGSLSSLSSKLNSELNSADETIYALVVLAVVALIVALVAVARKPSARPPAPQPENSPPMAAPPSPPATGEPPPAPMPADEI